MVLLVEILYTNQVRLHQNMRLEIQGLRRLAQNEVGIGRSRKEKRDGEMIGTEIAAPWVMGPCRLAVVLVMILQ